MKPTQEQVLQWALEAGGVEDLQWKGTNILRLATLAYEAGRKDERDSYETVLVEPPQGENND